MRTFSVIDDRRGRTIAFEIESAYISPSTVAQVLSAVDGVSEVKRRRPFSNWEEIHVRFRFRDAECVVWEPFGDNSRYWIGQQDVPEPVDLSHIELTFKGYCPSLVRRIFGDIVTFRFITRWFKGERQ